MLMNNKSNQAVLPVWQVLQIFINLRKKVSVIILALVSSKPVTSLLSVTVVTSSSSGMANQLIFSSCAFVNNKIPDFLKKSGILSFEDKAHKNKLLW